MGIPIAADVAKVDPIRTTGLDSPNIEYSQMQDTWDLVKALWGGTPTMREADKDYLPQFPGETDDEYKLRLDRTFLFGMYKRAIKALTGFPFSRMINLDDSDPRVQEWATNIDMEGNSLDVWARNVFETGFAYGHTYIYVDMPVSPVASPSKEEKRRLSLRPYFIHYRPDQVIGWKWENRGGVPMLTQVRLLEAARIDDSADPWNQSIALQIRVLEPGRVQVWRADTSANTNTGGPTAGVASTVYGMPASNVTDPTRKLSISNWVLINEYATMNMPTIPLVPFYTGRDGFMTSTPPLLDLAWLNVEHWQSSSEQATILHYARVPQKFYRGFRKEDVPTEHSSSLSVYNPDPDSDVKWVEIAASGQGAIPMGRQHLLDIESRAASLSTELLIRGHRGSSGSATDSLISAAESMSELGTFSIGLGDSLRQAFGYAMMYDGVASTYDRGLDMAGHPEVFQDYGISLDERPELEMLLKMFLGGVITPNTLLAESKKRGIVSERLDIDAEVEATREVREHKMRNEEKRGSQGLSNNEATAISNINDNPAELSDSDG